MGDACALAPEIAQLVSARRAKGRVCASLVGDTRALRCWVAVKGGAHRSTRAMTLVPPAETHVPVLVVEARSAGPAERATTGYVAGRAMAGGAASKRRSGCRAER
jgi:hypothetical protein